MLLFAVRPLLDVCHACTKLDVPANEGHRPHKHPGVLPWQLESDEFSSFTSEFKTSHDFLSHGIYGLLWHKVHIVIAFLAVVVVEAWDKFRFLTALSSFAKVKQLYER